MTSWLPSHAFDLEDESVPEGADDMKQWVKKEFGNKRINDAGKLLAAFWHLPNDPDRTDELSDAYRVVDNWRMAHAYPLNYFQDKLRKRATKVDPNAIVAQRMKRMDSVLAKLRRSEPPVVTTMQDLGGSRAILSTMSIVDSVLQTFVGPATLFPIEGKPHVDDYIKNPKSDGYRGIHIVGRYRPKAESALPWKGYRIEIQLRTALQHSCSTAVETVQTFTGQPLKHGLGSPEWKRFFVLASSAFAMLEGMPAVPGAPEDRLELLAELAVLERKLRVTRKLGAWALVPERILGAEKAKMFVLELLIGRNKGKKGRRCRMGARARVLSFTHSMTAGPLGRSSRRSRTERTTGSMLSLLRWEH